MTAATREFLRTRLATLVAIACAIVFGVIAGAATAAGNPPPNGCQPSGNKPKKCSAAPAPSPPAPAPPAPAPPQPAPPPPSPAPPPPAPPAAGDASGSGDVTSAPADDGTTRSTPADNEASLDGGTGIDGSSGDSTGTGGSSANGGAAAPPESGAPAPPSQAPSVVQLQSAAAPTGSAIETAKTAVAPVVAAVAPALAPTRSPGTAATPAPTADFGTPAFAAAAPSVDAQKVLRPWFAPHALVVLAHDVTPGVHAIRARLGRRAETLALGFGRPVATTAARRTFTAGGWLRSDTSGITVCIRVAETFRRHTIRTSETCSVAHRKWRHVALKTRTVAKGHRLSVSVYELGVSAGDSFDVGGFKARA